MQQAASIEDLIDKVRAGPTIERGAIERLLGTRLSEGEGTSAVDIYEASGVALPDGRVDIDLRAAKAGATTGGLLNLGISGACLKRGDVERKYGPLTLSGVPRGRSTEEPVSFSRDEPWGRLSFGFAQDNPDCVKTVTFDVEKR
ncbi:hypothetical protein [Glacieibacterium frigidum]|uniref:Uncharacterized protein n=1 Tax=Glacieibacterium frigidum TaxID=2593303 RepID=A0A552UEW1_9SPHN|nr:hypothetical protein [Glacieibacterium frigidum]TRW16741.1 hypothetical protein FMM06_00560 [Glacieibacterium frigidum]